MAALSGRGDSTGNSGGRGPELIGVGQIEDCYQLLHEGNEREPGRVEQGAKAQG